MARGRIKTEMKGTGGGRWCPRAVAKSDASRRRRKVDREEARTEACCSDPRVLGGRCASCGTWSGEGSVDGPQGDNEG